MLRPSLRWRRTPPGTSGGSGSAAGVVCVRVRDASAQRSDTPNHVFQDGVDQGPREGRREGRWHDNRHTLVTELAESGAGDEVIMSIAGHVSRAMLSRYSHVRHGGEAAGPRRDRRTSNCGGRESGTEAERRQQTAVARNCQWFNSRKPSSVDSQTAYKKDTPIPENSAPNAARNGLELRHHGGLPGGPRRGGRARVGRMQPGEALAAGGRARRTCAGCSDSRHGIRQCRQCRP